MTTLVGRRRGLGALALVVLVAGVLFVAGFSASYQVSSARRAMEKIESRGLRELAAASAFEEVAARLSGSLAKVAQLKQGESRDLGAIATWPGTSTPLTTAHTVEPEVARADLALAGVKLPGPVTIVSGPWETTAKARPDGTQAVQEIGIARLTTEVRLQSAGHTSAYTVTALRYFTARPDGPALALAIGSKNLALEVIEKP